MYILPMGVIMRSHYIQYHIYADNTQLHLSFDLTNPSVAVNNLNHDFLIHVISIILFHMNHHFSRYIIFSSNLANILTFYAHLKNRVFPSSIINLTVLAIASYFSRLKNEMLQSIKNLLSSEHF